MLIILLASKPPYLISPIQMIMALKSFPPDSLVSMT